MTTTEKPGAGLDALTQQIKSDTAEITAQRETVKRAEHRMNYAAGNTYFDAARAYDAEVAKLKQMEAAR